MTVGVSLMFCSCAKDATPVELSGSLEMQVGDSGLQKPRQFKVATQKEKGADMTWSCLDYKLSFTAGPYGEDGWSGIGKCFSYFNLRESDQDDSLCTIHSSIPAGSSEYDKCIDVFTTDKAEVIVIKEDNPNTSSPTYNFILLTKDECDFSYRYVCWPGIDRSPKSQKVISLEEYHHALLLFEPKPMDKISKDGVLFEDGSYMKWSEMKTQENPTLPG